MGKSDEWCTPPVILDVVRKMGTIRYDPCSNEHSLVEASEEGMLRTPEARDGVTMDFRQATIQGGINGLETDWAERGRGGLIYVNPPYSQPNLDLWTRKARREAGRMAEIVMLVPAYTGDGWFRRNVLMDVEERSAPVGVPAAALCFWWGRVRFWEDGKPGKHTARFSSCLVYWGGRTDAFEDACTGHGFVARRDR